jgi:hypothetical protein
LAPKWQVNTKVNPNLKVIISQRDTAILFTVKNIFEQDTVVSLIWKFMSQFTYTFASQAILEYRETFLAIVK